ncbi:UbiE/COQ5 methyltransferase [Akanthomyces lecanii RCEF 1005]|uniref:UbiE/COQ5 methyltransferase n=1 Tax=Akanthomyces lecanii RCEF 1005 TaxID=1081108 RepID=A0A168FE36_CORDF|nr:UbiE/COQ5 methyltransferase [Akanthomyces lecanii RCEF 1005]
MSNSAEVNQQYFNKIAADYDKRFAPFLNEINDELQSQADFIGIKKGARLLDYACGTGFVSSCFSDVIGQAVGVDITENMIGAYNVKAANANVPEDQRKAYLGNLLSTPPSPSLDGPLFRDFDVAGVGMGFHHFEDTTLAATRLAERLVPGGSLFVLDFLPHGADTHSGHDAVRGVHHMGFDEDKTRSMFEVAGAGRDFAYKELSSVIVMENTPEQGQTLRRRLFLARGTKTA